MLSKFIEAYADFEQLQQRASVTKKGRKGLDLGCSATVLDAAVLIKQSWDGLSTSAVLNCWRHSRCIPHLPSPPSPTPGASSSSVTRTAIEDLTSALTDVHASSALSELVDENVSDLLTRWLDLENDPEIVASNDLLLVDEVEASLLEDGEQHSPPPVEMDIQAPIEEKEICQQLLFYSNQAITMN